MDLGLGLALGKDELLGAAGIPYGPALAAKGITFNGSTSIKRGAAPGFSSLSAGLCAFWYRQQANSGFHIAGSNNATTSVFEIIGDRNNDEVILLVRSAGGSVLQVNWDTDGAFGGDFFPFIISWDANFSAGNKLAKCSIGGVVAGENSRSDVSASFNVDWANATDFLIGSAGNGGDTCNGDIAEFYLDVRASGSYVDAADPVIIGRYLSTGPHPADIGSNGIVLNGNIPKIYLSARDSDVASAFLTNRGSIGNFAVNAGSLSIAAAVP